MRLMARMRRPGCFASTCPIDTIMQVQRFVNPQCLVEFEVDAIVSNATAAEEIRPAAVSGGPAGR